MDRSRLEILPKVWLDYRRSVFLEKDRILAVADLHLGYTWAHRFHGQLLPVDPRDNVLERLTELCVHYQPQALVLLGDIVHQTVPVKEIADELSEMLRHLSAHCSVRLILGNHDRQLKRFLGRYDLDIECHRSIHAADFLLLHGHESADAPDVADGHGTEPFTIMGHEHPAISLGDGIKSAKFPCFVLSHNLLVLPAFSQWSAGSNVRWHEMSSPLARSAQFHKAIAICGSKLLPVALNSNRTV